MTVTYTNTLLFRRTANSSISERQPSRSTGTEKNFSLGRPLSVIIPGKQTSQAMAQSRSRRNATRLQGGLSVRPIMTRQNEAIYQDTNSSVHQWMANSNQDTNSFNLDYLEAIPQVSTPNQVSGSYTTTTACAYPPAPLASTGIHNGLGINSESMNVSTADFAVPSMDKGFDIPLDCSLIYPGFPGEHIPADYNAPMANYSLPSPEYDDMQSCASTNSQIMFVEGNATDAPPGWDTHANNGALTRATSPGSQPMDWSSSGFSNSVASSNSHDHFIQLPDTPLSMTIGEDAWCADQLAPSGISENFVSSDFVESTQQSGAFCTNDQRFELCRQTGLHLSDFTCSTMRPNRIFQRPPIPTMDVWPQPPYGKAYVTPPYTMNNSRRPSEEGTLSARKDARYQVQRQEDNMFHCPIEGCTHKPESLKCNYE